MSSLQPVTASESNVHVSPPSFSVAMRGYDRKQVQSFVDEQRTQRCAVGHRRPPLLPIGKLSTQRALG